jgi:hypothetical protein
MRKLARLFAIAAGAVLLVAQAAAEEIGWRTAVARLAQEKVLAEGCISILKSSSVGHPMARVQGERLYARAKADADGLIALLKTSLVDDRSPADSPELRQRLKTIPRQRQALCRQVRAALGASADAQGESTSGLLDRGSDEAPGPLAEAALQIRQTHRHGGGTHRGTITLELEATRWLPYAEVP